MIFWRHDVPLLLLLYLAKEKEIDWFFLFYFFFLLFTPVMDYRRSITEWERTRDRWVEEMKNACQV